MTMEGQMGWKLNQTESAKGTFNAKKKGSQQIKNIPKTHSHMATTKSMLNTAKNGVVENYIRNENKNPPTWVEDENGKLRKFK